MQTSQEVINIFKALCECKKDFLPLQKNKEGYGYKYVTLDSVIEMLNTVLPKHGLGFIQFPSTDNGEYTLTTRIIHVSGEWIEDTITFNLTEISKANDTQKLGASVTYFRRYTLSTIFGIAADEDIDGNLETAVEIKNYRPKKQQFNESFSEKQKNTNVYKNENEINVENKVEKSFFVNEKINGLYLTTNNEINSELKLIVNEEYKNEKVLSEKTISFIISKCDSNSFSSAEEYLSYVKRASVTNKKRIDEKIKIENQQSDKNEIEF